MAGFSNLENKCYELGLRSSIQQPELSKDQVRVTNFFDISFDLVAREEADIAVGGLQENSFIPLLCYQVTQSQGG